MGRDSTWCTPAQAARNVLSVGMWGTSGPCPHRPAEGRQEPGPAGLLRSAPASVDSDCVSVTDSQLYSGDLYILEEINGFLDETLGKSVKVVFSRFREIY